MDHGPGLLEPFLNQIWTLLKGVGAVAAWSAVRGPRSFDGLAEAVSHFIDFQALLTCL